MFADYGELRPLREAADILAEHPWPRLYDADVLRRNEVPVAGTIYVHDLYVEREFAEETARLVRGMRTWIRCSASRPAGRAARGRARGVLGRQLRSKHVRHDHVAEHEVDGTLV